MRLLNLKVTRKEAETTSILQLLQNLKDNSSTESNANVMDQSHVTEISKSNNLNEEIL